MWKIHSTFFIFSDCRCGVKKSSSSRIVGGTPVDNPVSEKWYRTKTYTSQILFQINKYPWIVSIQRSSDSGHLCGGSLVASAYVVTSARCLHSYTEADIQVGGVLCLLKIVENLVGFSFSRDILSLHCRNLQCVLTLNQWWLRWLYGWLYIALFRRQQQTFTVRDHTEHWIALFRLLSNST